MPMSHMLNNYTSTWRVRDSSGYILPKDLQDYLWVSVFTEEAKHILQLWQVDAVVAIPRTQPQNRESATSTAVRAWNVETLNPTESSDSSNDTPQESNHPA